MGATNWILYVMAIIGMATLAPFAMPVILLIFGIHMYHKKRKEVVCH